MNDIPGIASALPVLLTQFSRIANNLVDPIDSTNSTPAFVGERDGLINRLFQAPSNPEAPQSPTVNQSILNTIKALTTQQAEMLLALLRRLANMVYTEKVKSNREAQGIQDLLESIKANGFDLELNLPEELEDALLTLRYPDASIPVKFTPKNGGDQKSFVIYIATRNGTWNLDGLYIAKLEKHIADNETLHLRLSADTPKAHDLPDQVDTAVVNALNSNDTLDIIWRRFLKDQVPDCGFEPRDINFILGD